MEALAPALERVYAVLASLTIVADPGQYFSAPAIHRALHGARLWDPGTDGRISTEQVHGFLHVLCDSGSAQRAELLSRRPAPSMRSVYGYRARFA